MRPRLPDSRNGRKRAVFAIPGDLDTPTGGYAYDRQIIGALRGDGWNLHHLPLPGRFPEPAPGDLATAYRLLAAQPDGVPVVVDGLALGVLPEIGRHLGRLQPLVALVHHPLALESGLSRRRAVQLLASERAALAAACRVIATSRTTAATLASAYDVPGQRVSVAVPGTEPVPFAAGSGEPVPHLLSVGTLVPRKGHDLLIAALALLQDLPWRLSILGDDRRDPATVQALRAAVAGAGLERRVSLKGAVDAGAVARYYAGADLFVLASRHEGYGMAYAEAIARGLPVIGTTAGAIPEVVPAGAGLLVPPDDVPALAAALRTLLADPAARHRLAEAARRASAALPRWSESAAVFADALRGAASGRPA